MYRIDEIVEEDGGGRVGGSEERECTPDKEPHHQPRKMGTVFSGMGTCIVSNIHKLVYVY